MAQVLTSEGLAEFHATGKIPDFVKPGTETPPEPKEVKEPPASETAEPSQVSTADDEDDQGLTAAERKAYSEKIAKKISAKHRALKQAEAFGEHQSRERQAAEKKAAELAKEIESLRAAVPKVATESTGPQRKDFESDADWWDAKIEWKAEQKAESKFKELESAREKARAEKVMQDRIAKFAETVEDYDETVDVNNSKPMYKAVIDHLQESDFGPQIAYYYGKHPAEYDKLSQLSATAAVAAIGKLEAKLEREAESKLKAEDKTETIESLKAPISRAPAPIQAIPEAAAPVQKDPSKMNFEELRAYNRQQRLRALG